MGLAYYIVLDNDEPDFDTFVNGKALAHEEALESICKAVGIEPIDKYLTMSADDIGDMLGEEIELPDGVGEEWFLAEEGITYFSKLAEYIEANPNSVSNLEGCLEDLKDYNEVLEKAKAIEAKWHLNVDF